MIYLIGVFVSLFITWFFIRTRKPTNFPPGPPRLPIVGSLPFLTGSGKKPSVLLGISDQVKKHGNIIGIYLQNTPTVVLTDYDQIKELFKSEKVAARPDMDIIGQFRIGANLFDKKLFGSMPGVVFSRGPYWKELRRFLLRNLRDFGFGKSSMNDSLQSEVAKLCRLLEKKAGQPISLFGLMNISVVNSLWYIIVGEELDLEDPQLERLVKLVNALIASISPNGSTALAALLPSPQIATWPIMHKLIGFQLAKETIESVFNTISPYVEDHEKTLDPDNVRDLLDLMLMEEQNNTDPDSCFSPKLGRTTTLNSIFDLFIAGMETTSSTLNWIILLLLHHPDVQEKVHQEMDQVIGTKRLPNLDDQKDLPFINAVLQETLRVSSLLSLGIPHYAVEDLTIGGYNIPKGTTVLGSLYHCMRDQNHFSEPEIFDPNRFFKDGKFVHDERVIPFGTGKRVCLGQSLAEKQLFLFFTGMLQRFVFKHAPGTTLPSYVDINSGASIQRVVDNYYVILESRAM